MRLTPLIVGFATTFLTGCSLFDRANHNVRYEKTLQADLAARRSQHRTEAAIAWGEFQPTGSGVGASFGEGFVDGFADFLDHGGRGEAPPVPPSKYWFGPGRTPAGRQAGIDYLEGFGLGARAAKDSGIRPAAQVPVRLAIPAMPDAGVVSRPSGELPRPMAVPATESGPMPRETTPKPPAQDPLPINLR